MKDLEQVTKEDFEAYENVRSSGVTNMYAVRTVMGLSGLDRDTITAIMTHYSALMKKFPGVRKRNNLNEPWI